MGEEQEQRGQGFADTPSTGASGLREVLAKTGGPGAAERPWPSPIALLGSLSHLDVIK